MARRLNIFLPVVEKFVSCLFDLAAEFAEDADDLAQRDRYRPIDESHGRVKM
jgi:hypothetical protein